MKFKVGDKVETNYTISGSKILDIVIPTLKGVVVATYKDYHQYPYDVKFDGVTGLWPIKEDEII